MTEKSSLRKIRRTTPIGQKEAEDYVGEYAKNWDESGATLTSWIMGTFITINLGGIYFALTNHIQPAAISEACKFFMISLGLTITSALFEVFRIERMRYFRSHLKIVMHAEIYTIDDFEKRILSLSSRTASLTLLISSMVFTCLGGSQLISGTIPCSAADLETSIMLGTNVGGDGAHPHDCYFYKIDGLPDDPLQRAIAEKKLLMQSRLPPKR